MLGADWKGQSYKCILLSLLTCPSVGRVRTEEDVDGEACDIPLTKAVASFFSASEGGASRERAIIWLDGEGGSGEEQLDFKCSCSSTTNPQQAQCTSWARVFVPQHVNRTHAAEKVVARCHHWSVHMHFLHCRSESGMVCDGGRNRLSDRG